MDNQEMTEQEKVLYANVYLPAFVEKCASMGFQFPDEASLNDALEIAALAKSTLQSHNSNMFKEANDSLKRALGLVVDMDPVQVKKASAYQSNAEVRKAVSETLTNTGK